MSTARQLEGQMMLPVLHPDLSAALTRRIMPGWQTQAACAKAWPDLFFPDSDGDSTDTTTAALTVCNGCRVRSSCRAAGLLGVERGIWGGSTETDRDRMHAALDSGASVDAVLLATLDTRRRDAA